MAFYFAHFTPYQKKICKARVCSIYKYLNKAVKLLFKLIRQIKVIWVMYFYLNLSIILLFFLNFILFRFVIHIILKCLNMLINTIYRKKFNTFLLFSKTFLSTIYKCQTATIVHAKLVLFYPLSSEINLYCTSFLSILGEFS